MSGMSLCISLSTDFSSLARLEVSGSCHDNQTNVYGQTVGVWALTDWHHRRLAEKSQTFLSQGQGLLTIHLSLCRNSRRCLIKNSRWSHKRVSVVFLSRLSVEVTLWEIDSRNEWSAKATITVYLKYIEISLILSPFKPR